MHVKNFSIAAWIRKHFLTLFLIVLILSVNIISAKQVIVSVQ